MADEFVRVRSAAGKESSISEAFVEGLEKGAVEVLDEPATNTWGRPLPATRSNGRRSKPRTTVKKAAAKKTAAAQKTATTAGSPEEGN
jgi:hypothetical protein